MKPLSQLSPLPATAAALVVLSCCAIQRTEAVVIASGDGSGNTTAPGDDPGFANVGTRGGGGAVYLGNRWILTVAHLSAGGGTAIFNGTTYGFVSGTDTRLSNPMGSGLTGVVDLRMIRLDGDPGLPTVTIASAAPTVAMDVIKIGRGRNRATAPTFWEVSTAPDPDVWTVITPPPPADAEGFEAAGLKTKRWGENEVLDDDLVVNAGWGNTQSFSTNFDLAGKTHESQAVAGDSGGGVFSKDGGSWELVGIMHTVSAFDGQPTNTAVYDNQTNAADLSFYADEINAVVATPEPGTSCLMFASLVLCLGRRR